MTQGLLEVTLDYQHMRIKKAIGVKNKLNLFYKS
jgi:hypothetical protein